MQLAILIISAFTLLFAGAGLLCQIFTYSRTGSIGKESRIASVADRYFRLVHNSLPIDEGIGGLKKAGICNLKDDTEIKETIESIAASEGKHPLGQYKDRIYSASSLKKFFKVWQPGKSVDEVIKSLE